MRYSLLLSIAVLCSQVAFAQQTTPKGQLHGNFSMMWQQYNEDSLIGARVPDAKSAMNAFGNITYSYGDFSAGVRFESYQNALLGFPKGFNGTGIGSRYARYNNDNLDITVGNFYEQFGNGLIFRSYWEPMLGIDNALDGMRVLWKPYRGIYLKGVYGNQRAAFDSRLINGSGLVRGVDSELNLKELFPKLDTTGRFNLTLGTSFVSKFEAGQTIEKGTEVFDLPQNVGAWASRLKLEMGNFQINGEYATKINDPNADNGFIYKKGQAMFLNAGYSKKGIGINVNGKLVDNMAFRSSRDALLFELPINFLPAITKQHTYNLAATLYPYATVLNGENGFSAEVYYTFKKKTKLGGKYGTNISLNFAAVNSLDTTRFTGRDGMIWGYERNSLGFGSTKFVRDFNVDLKKKISNEWSMALTYYYFEFNTLATPVTQDFKGIVYADIFVGEFQYKIDAKNTVRMELQNLQTDQDKGDWATIVAEYTFSPHWTFSLIDQYNYGNDNADARVHYLYGAVAYSKGSNRLSIGYGKRREGIFCIGGVCRAVPASNGVEITISSSF
ncbi:MAG: hypothetical protein RLZZ262_1613 [Bacteroidota bacterium]|jgi:hypothetical protein